VLVGFKIIIIIKIIKIIIMIIMMITPLLRVICFPYAGTLYSLPVCLITLVSAVPEIWLMPTKI